MNRQKVAVITSPSSSVGFALAGVRVYEATDGLDAARLIDQVVEDVDAGVVMLDEPLYNDLPDEVRRELERSARPIVIPVPGPDWETVTGAEEYIVEILRRAIGYRVRLQ